MKARTKTIKLSKIRIETIAKELRCLTWKFKDLLPKYVQGFCNFPLKACGSRADDIKTII